MAYSKLTKQRQIVDRRAGRYTSEDVQRALFEETPAPRSIEDLERRVAAVGGELHADAEQLLLETGSRQADLWGANYYPGRGRDGCIEYTSLINIRPAQGNRSMRIEDPLIRERVRALTFTLLGEGEPLG